MRGLATHQTSINQFDETRLSGRTKTEVLLWRFSATAGTESEIVRARDIRDQRCGHVQPSRALAKPHEASDHKLIATAPHRVMIVRIACCTRSATFVSIRSAPRQIATGRVPARGMVRQGTRAAARSARQRAPPAIQLDLPGAKLPLRPPFCRPLPVHRRPPLAPAL